MTNDRPGRTGPTAALGAALALCLLVAGCRGGDAKPTDFHVPSTPPPTDTRQPDPGRGPEGLDSGLIGQPGTLQIDPVITRAEPMVPIHDFEHRSINLSASRNEVASFQLAIEPGRYQGLRIRATDLVLPGQGPDAAPAGRIAGDAVRMFRVAGVRVVGLPAWYHLYPEAGGSDAADRSSGDFPDALVPLNHPRFGQPFNLAADERLTVWIDVAVPADQPPGQYRGQVRLTSDGRPDRPIDLNLQVLPLALPQRASLTMLAPIDVKANLARELGLRELTDTVIYAEGRAKQLARKRLAQWIELGREHGVHFLPADIAPIFRRDLAGRVTVDWTGYDLLLGRYLKADDAPPVWLAPYRLDYPNAPLYGGVTGKAYATVAEEYLREIGGHFITNGWPRPLVWFHRDAPPQATLPYGAWHWRDYMTQQRRDESLTIGRIVRLTELEIDYLETLPWAQQPAGPERPGGLLVPPHVSVYCPPAQFLRASDIEGVTDRQARVWLGAGAPPWRPSTAVFASPDQVEALAYLAWRRKLEAVWLGPTQHWPRTSPFEKPLPADEAHFLFYPGDWFGQDEPIASVRLKYLRRAVQDHAYLKLLSDAGRPIGSDAVAGAVVKHALARAEASLPGLGGAVGWLTQPAFYEDARMILRQELTMADNPDIGREFTRLAQNRWLRFMERAAWIQLTLLPGQLTDEVDRFGAPTGKLRAVQRVDARLDRPELVAMPAGVMGGDAPPQLRYGELPKTWTATRFNVPLSGEPGEPGRTLALAAEGVEMPINRTGRIAMPLLVTGPNMRELVNLAASVPTLPALRFENAPTIDGKLNDDWPADSWFRGAGFQRLAWGRTVGMFGRTPASAAATWIMAGYDEQRLYLAAACLGEPLANIRYEASNRVATDAGLVVGDDAIEFILDPTGGGLESGDLFRLLVKANGVLIARRGVTGDGGTGPARVWGKDIRVAVNYRKDGWLAELAIDLDELAPTNPNGLWRLNAVRHYAAHGEHSAWASGHPMIYDPHTLGNLLLRKPKLPDRKVPLMPVSPLSVP